MKKRYVVEVTRTPNSLNYLYPRGYKESYISKGKLVCESKDFFMAPAFWSEYCYTSKRRAKRDMKILQKYTQGEEYWDSSFRVVEVEVNDCGHVARCKHGPMLSYFNGIVQSHWFK